MAPKYRQIPTKTPESFDFNEMPTDFGRMFWLLLPVCLDSEGRGHDNVQWLRSKLFPIREDDPSELIRETMDWLATRRMIIRYEVDGRRYFHSVNFKKYQSGTDKEAPSYLPAPETDQPTPDQLQSNSRVTPEQVRLNTMQCNADAGVTTTKFVPFSSYGIRVWCKVTGMTTIPGGELEKVEPAMEALYYQHDQDEGALVAYLKPYWEKWKTSKSKNGKPFSRSNCAWLYDWAVSGDLPENGKPKDRVPTEEY